MAVWSTDPSAYRWLLRYGYSKLPYMEREKPPSRTFMVVERFKNNDAVPVYRRFRDKGRMMPDGLAYIASWVDENFERCYQVMETYDRRLLDEWMANWKDLMDFEVSPVITSKEAMERIRPKL
jgi:hypothetical protein